MFGRTIRIGTISGIPFGIHPLWTVMLALVTWSLATGWYPAVVDGIAPWVAWTAGLASALLLFASVLAHEYGHAIVARRRGVDIEEIDLWLLGGVARMRNPARRPQDELAYAIAGPAVSLALALLAAAFVPLLSPGTVLFALVAYQALINAMVLAFNLLPAFPLDGGRVLHALLWRHGGDAMRATVAAARIGRGFGVLFIALGLLEVLAGAPAGVWLAVIGWFVMSAGRAEVLHAEVTATFTGIRARELMHAPVLCLPVTATAREAADLALRHPHRAFPVLDGERAIGLVPVAALEEIPSARRGAVLVAELADRDPALLVRADADIAALLDEPAFLRVRCAAVVGEDGRAIGVVSLTDLERTLDARRRLGPPVAPPPPGAGVSAGGAGPRAQRPNRTRRNVRLRIRGSHRFTDGDRAVL